MNTNLEKCRDRRGAAAFCADLGYPVAYATLERLAVVGGGSLFHKFGRKPIYREADLVMWIRSRCTSPRCSTSDVGDARERPPPSRTGATCAPTQESPGDELLNPFVGKPQQSKPGAAALQPHKCSGEP